MQLVSLSFPPLVAIPQLDHYSLHRTVIILTCLQTQSIPSKPPCCQRCESNHPFLLNLTVLSIIVLLIDPHIPTLPLATSLCCHRPSAIPLSQSEDTNLSLYLLQLSQAAALGHKAAYPLRQTKKKKQEVTPKHKHMIIKHTSEGSRDFS